MTRQEQLHLQRELEEIGAQGEIECPICGAVYGPSEEWPWHWPSEDCRAVREPRKEAK